ncbi:cation/multidrug efflux pump [Oceanicoccus sagamiensis]|uniref:Cation/multidrug efflux pump n=1 Tax=Oceanicoccus sagamiensis TaxID=716816 RepID=A0A1X9NCU3_9GAMM|nr:cation/multidrug efflux pump [Oceanicoccus sagamiensis]ARN75850.1 cation/multidrug efflux pump [Oceanicoccus sagamiensis]
MAYTLLAGIIIVVALFIVLAAGRLLFKGRWFLGWLRGMSGLLLVVASVLLALAAFDFYSYKQLSKEETIATISFARLDEQRFQVSLVDSDGVERSYELNGDLWQLDARIIKWNRFFAGMGMQPGYRMDRLSGRYYSLEKEHSEQRTVYQLSNSKSVLDMWSWLHEYGQNMSVVDASYGSATYLPMDDGALFSVSLSSTGLVSRPLNERAKEAVEGWQ